MYIKLGKWIFGILVLICFCLGQSVFAKQYTLFSIDDNQDWSELSPESHNVAGYSIVSWFSELHQTMLVIYARDEKEPLNRQELKQRAQSIISALKSDGFILTNDKFNQERGYLMCKGRLHGMPMRLRIYQIESLFFVVMVVGKDLKAGSKLASTIEAFY